VVRVSRRKCYARRADVVGHVSNVPLGLWHVGNVPHVRVLRYGPCAWCDDACSHLAPRDEASSRGARRLLWLRFCRFRSLLALIAFCLILSPAPTFAHRIHVFAYGRGTTIQGQAYFTEDSPARHVTVTALDPAGEEIGKTTTDEEGQFTLEARFRCDHLIQVSTSDGHGGAYTVSASELSRDLPPRDGSADSPPPSSSEVPSHPGQEHTHAPPPEAGQEHIEELFQQIVELRKRFDSYTDRIRLQDVLGAVGYILGLAGVAFYFLGTRQKPLAPSRPAQHESDQQVSAQK